MGDDHKVISIMQFCIGKLVKTFRALKHVANLLEAAPNDCVLKLDICGSQSIFRSCLQAKGNAAFAAGSFEEAIEHFSAGIAEAPENHVLYSNRSACKANTPARKPSTCHCDLQAAATRSLSDLLVLHCDG